MITDHQMTCPVCRAKQIPQTICRRCEADLSLYIKATTSLAVAQQQYALKSQNGDQAANAELQKYLQWLRPT
jgi:hypothetical protein